MAFQNPPVTELRVPDNAGTLKPGGGRVAGIVITDQIPTAIVNKYAPTVIASVTLYYGTAETTYYYDLLLGTQRIHGVVFDDASVFEITRELLGSPDPTTNLPVLKSMGEFQPEKLRNRYSAIVRRDTSQGTGAVTFTVLEYSGGGFVPAMNTTPFTIPFAGVYTVIGRAWYTSGAVGNIRATAVRLNGALWDEDKNVGVGVAQQQQQSVVTTRVFNQGDTIGLNVFGTTIDQATLSIQLESVL